MKPIMLSLLLSILFVPSFSQQHLSKQAEKALKKAIGSDLSNYKIYSYPTNNFGLATSCDKKWDLSTHFECDTWKCLMLPKVDDTSSVWVTLNGFESDGVGATVTDTATITNNYVLGFALPKIFQILNIGLSFGINNTKVINMSFSGTKRFLDRQKFDSVMSHRPDGDEIKDAYQNHRLVVVTSDFILTNFSVKVSVNDSTAGALNLKLGTDSLSNILSGDSLQIKVQRIGKGLYNMSSVKPIVFAVAVKKQPKSGGLAKPKDFSDYDQIDPDTLADPTNK